MTAASLAQLIETAARAANCCPHSIYLSRKRTENGGAATVARKLIFLRLRLDGYSATQIAKAFALHPHTIREHIHSLNLISVQRKPVFQPVAKALHLTLQ